MAHAVEIIIGLLVLLGVPIFLGVVWLVRRNQRHRRAALELKNGNRIYSQWRRGATNPPPR